MVSARGLAPGKHAVHIHEVGACTPTCAAAGSHVDLGPFGTNLPGDPPTIPFTPGDLINLQNRGQWHRVDDARDQPYRVSGRDLSIFDADGASIVIQALAGHVLRREPGRSELLPEVVAGAAYSDRTR
jgi:Cu-Zn family superoxide dismutase